MLNNPKICKHISDTKVMVGFNMILVTFQDCLHYKKKSDEKTTLENSVHSCSRVSFQLNMVRSCFLSTICSPILLVKNLIKLHPVGLQKNHDFFRKKTVASTGAELHVAAKRTCFLFATWIEDWKHSQQFSGESKVWKHPKKLCNLAAPRHGWSRSGPEGAWPSRF